MAYTSILTETHGQVGLVRLNRPQAMNALNPQLMQELLQALTGWGGVRQYLQWPAVWFAVLS